MSGFSSAPQTPHNGHRRVVPVGKGASGGCVAATPGAAAYFAAASPLVHAVMVEHLRRGGVGRTLIERTAELIGSPDTSDFPAMAIVAVDLDGVHVLVHGPLQIDVQQGDQHRNTLFPTEPIRSALGDPVIRRLDAVRSLTVCSTHNSAVAARSDHLLTELRDGVIPAEGLVVTWSADVLDVAWATDTRERNPIGHDAPPAPAATTTESQDESVAELFRGLDRTAAPPQQFSVLGGREVRVPTVAGLLCSRQHFNDPEAHFCAHCGIAMHQASFVLVQRPRPPLGVLVFDTGEAFEVAGDLSIGRDPSGDSLVTSGLARALRPSGDISGLSRVHASVHLDEWNVTVKDRGSLNGTFIWDRQTTQWKRIAPEAVAPIRPGDMIGFGRRTATFQTSIRPS